MFGTDTCASISHTVLPGDESGRFIVKYIY